MGSTFLAGLGDSGFHAIAQDVALELGEHRQHAGKCTAAWRGHIERLRE